MIGATSREKAYLAPFATFLAFILLRDLVAGAFEGSRAWPLSQPAYWLYPLQTFVVAAVLAWGWRCYDLRRPAQPAVGLFIGGLALVVWLAPRWLWAAPRLEGFDPHYFGTTSGFWLNVSLRFLRLVLIVPLAEEIFWRGFLARYLHDPDFTKVPIGFFTWRTFAVTTIGFVFEHSRADWSAALVTGVLFNFVAWRTRSLSCCVLAHAVTNALLGWYVMRTGEWGYW